MDYLNSQHLTFQDGYLHAFRQAGTYAYRVFVAPPELQSPEQQAAFTVEVAAEGREVGKGTQHNVTLRWDAAARRYQPEPTRLAIGVNDFVLWHAEGTAPIPPYSIQGGTKEAPIFDSRALGDHDVFTHMFLQPGAYTYQVGGQGEGRIVVGSHREVGREAYQRVLQSAAVIQIAGGKPNPSAVQIVAGQTVLWFVQKGERISIVSTAGARPSRV